jgi:hypothetical protein
MYISQYGCVIELIKGLLDYTWMCKCWLVQVESLAAGLSAAQLPVLLLSGRLQGVSGFNLVYL